MDEHESESPTKRNRPGKAGPLGVTPASYEEAGSEDKLIIQMREKDGKGWSDIREEIEKITGAKFGSTTLKNRYARMKANFVVFEKDHVCCLDLSWVLCDWQLTSKCNFEQEPILLEIKKDIEDKFEIEKWQRIADGIEARCGQKYPTAAIQKKFKELSKKVNANGLVMDG